jgi:hypothetical protein
LNPKAEVTAIYYERMRVVKNFAFDAGKLQAEDVDAMVKQVRDALTVRKKKG